MDESNIEKLGQAITSLQEIERAFLTHLVAVERVFQNSGGLADIVKGMDISFDKLQIAIVQLKEIEIEEIRS